MDPAVLRRARIGTTMTFALGAALWARSLERRWVVRKPSTRVVVVTETGRRGLSKHLGVRADYAPASIEAEPTG